MFKQHKVLLSSLAILLASSMSLPSLASAKKVHTHHHIKTTLVKKHHARHHLKKAKKHNYSFKKYSHMYKVGFRDASTPAYYPSQIRRARKLDHNAQFEKGADHFFNINVGQWSYSHKNVKAHDKKFMRNFRRYLNGRYHFRMGYLAGTQADPHNSKRIFNKINHTKRTRAFKAGFYAGVYNIYGSKAKFRDAYNEFVQLGHIKDDIAPVTLTK